jgi:tRNA-splicing ligase RtcB
MERYHIIPYLPTVTSPIWSRSSEIFDDYVAAVEWAQDYAMREPRTMMVQTIAALREIAAAVRDHRTRRSTATTTTSPARTTSAERDRHPQGRGQRARGRLGIIPGSMGTRSFIVRGKGNPDSFCSCSHGAGRRCRAGRRSASRSRIISQATEGVECRKDADVLDESPAAYKDLAAVIAAQPIRFEEANTLWRGDGKDVGDLPAFVDAQQTITKWELTEEEVAYIRDHGHVWVSQLNGGRPLQPQCVSTRYPFHVADVKSDEPQDQS